MTQVILWNTQQERQQRRSAIYKALGWTSNISSKNIIKINSDSLSSLQVISASKPTNPQVFEINIQLKHLLHKSSLGRVSVIQGDLW